MSKVKISLFGSVFRINTILIFGSYYKHVIIQRNAGEIYMKKIRAK